MNPPPLSLCQVLEEEFCALHGKAASRDLDPSRLPQDTEEERRRLRELWGRVHALPRQKRSALCISGGGIRSATTGLGVLQGLAQNGLLGQFDYLSTVSGGGYIGGWLTGWMHHQRTTLLRRAVQQAQQHVAAAANPLDALDPWDLTAAQVHSALVQLDADGRQAARQSLRALCTLACHHAYRGMEAQLDGQAGETSLPLGRADALDTALRTLSRLATTCLKGWEVGGENKFRREQIKAEAESAQDKLKELQQLISDASAAFLFASPFPMAGGASAQAPPEPPVAFNPETVTRALSDHMERAKQLSEAAEAVLDILNALGAQISRAVLLAATAQRSSASAALQNAVSESTEAVLRAVLIQHLRVVQQSEDVSALSAAMGSPGMWTRLTWKAKRTAMFSFPHSRPDEIALESLPLAARDLAYQAARFTVLCELGSSPPNAALDPEAEAVQHLRQYSNYLDPSVGLLSADTWTLGATVLRNLFLNWTVLIPALAAALMFPRLHLAMVALPYPPASMSYSDALNQGLFWLAIVIAVLAMARMRLSLPSVGGKPVREGQFVRRIFFGLFFSSWLLSLAWSWGQKNDWYPPQGKPAYFVLAFFIGNWMILHWLAWLPVSWQKVRQGFFPAFFSVRRFLDFWAVVVAGGLQGLALWFLATQVSPKPFDHLAAYACLATPAILLTFLLASTVYLGIASLWTTDEDREWHARAGGWMLMGLAIASAMNVLVIYGVPLLLKAKVVAASLGGLTGIIAIGLGRSSKSDPRRGAAKQPLWMRLVYGLAPKLAAPAFVVLVLVSIAFATTWLIGEFGQLEGFFFEGEFTAKHHYEILKITDVRLLAAMAAGLAVFSLLMGSLVNVNKFSLHFLYRNRLIRAYLGASRRRDERKPNPFTGFDPQDNIAMHKLSRRQKPFHVLNVNLNLAGDPGLAWQQRKAESFTISPLHAGSPRLKIRGGVATGLDASTFLQGAYRPAKDYASLPAGHGITLGTAVAVSGAAANPNMGYNSSALVAFLMTFFNARLGCWLGNPAPIRDRLTGIPGFQPTWKLSGPRFCLRPLLAEAFSMVDDREPYVNLSDGGHFENLALYEMVLRRCHFILVLDNGKDNPRPEEYAFEDLGNALRKIRVDFGVPIEIDFHPIRERKTHFVTGKIHYSAVDGPDVPDGVLVLVKPVLAGDDEPADVFNYAVAKPDFPQQSTSNQWFNESQFESYRVLGLHSVDKMPTAEWSRLINCLGQDPPAARQAGAGGT